MRQMTLCKSKQPFPYLLQSPPLTHPSDPNLLFSIIVGEEEKTWTFPRRLLARDSKFFRDMFDAETDVYHPKGTTPDYVMLPETSPVIFGFIAEYLTTGTVAEALSDDDVHHAHYVGGPAFLAMYDHDSPTFVQLILTWLLAYNLEMPALQNQVICLLQDRATKRKWLPATTFKTVYKRTGLHSQLMRWIMDTYVWGELEVQHLKADVAEMFPEKVLAEIGLSLVSRTSAGFIPYEEGKSPLDDIMNYSVYWDI